MAAILPTADRADGLTRHQLGPLGCVLVGEDEDMGVRSLPDTARLEIAATRANAHQDLAW